MNRSYKPLALICVVTLSACSKSSGGGSNPAVNNTVASDVTSLKDLSLSGVLAISLPASVVGGSTSLNLDGSNKSFEACKLRQEMREGLSNIAEASTMLCMLENDPGIKFGTKYNVDFSAMTGGGGAPPSGGGGMPPGELPPGDFPPPGVPALRLANGLPDSMQIWIDNSSADKLTVYMCQDKKLSQMIEVTAAKKGQAKGRMIMDQSLTLGDFAMTFSRAMSFDSNYTTEGTSVVTLKELVGTSSGQFGEEKARRLLALSLSETGVSKVLSSFAGTSAGVTSSFSSIGAFDKDFGSVIAKGSFQPSIGDAVEFSNESFFDGSSFVVDPNTYPDAFGAAGKVKVAAADLPGFLSETFKPESFPVGAWDCTGTTDLDFNAGADAGASSAITSCTGEFDQLAEQDCMGAGFAAGAEVTIDPSTLPPPDSIDFGAEGSIEIK